MDCQALESFQYLTVEGQLCTACHSELNGCRKVSTLGLCSHRHTHRWSFQWHKITSFHSRSQKVAYLKGLSFFSKGHENSRNKKIDDHKYHQDGAGEDQEAA